MTSTTAESIRDRLAPAPGIDFGAAILIFLGVDACIVVALCIALAPQALAVVVPVTLAAPFLIGGAINALCWAPWARRYPARPQRHDAVVKKNESFTLGRFVALNNAVHLAADADHLHLIPCLLLRLGGAKVISLPWSRITRLGPSGFSASAPVRATIDGRSIRGPGWCLSIAPQHPQAGARP